MTLLAPADAAVDMRPSQWSVAGPASWSRAAEQAGNGVRLSREPGNTALL